MVVDVETAKLGRLKDLVNAAKSFTEDRNDVRRYHQEIYAREGPSGDTDSRSNIRYGRGRATRSQNEDLYGQTYDAESSHKTPFPRAFVNSKASFVTNLFFDSEGNLFRGTSSNIYSADKVKGITKVLNKQIKKLLFPTILNKVAKSTFVEDIGVMQVKWKYDSLDINIFRETQFLESLKERHTDAKSLEEIDAAIAEELEKLAPIMGNQKHPSEFNGVDIEIIKPCDFYIDPNTEGDIDNAEFVYVKKSVPLSKLKSLVKMGRIPEDKFAELEKGHAKRYSSKSKGPKGKYGYSPKYDPNIDLYEIWEKGLVSLVTCDLKLILDYRRDVFFGLIKYPFVVTVNNPTYSGFFGDGDYKGMEPMIEAIDRMQSNMVDHYEKHLKGRMFITPALQQDSVFVKRMQNGDAGVFGVPSLNGFKDDRLPLFDQAVVSAQNGFIAQLQSGLGVDDLSAQGTIGSNFRTDATVQAYLQSAQAQMNFTISVFKEALKRLGKLMMVLNSLFLKEGETFVLTGGKATDPVTVYNTDIPLDLEVDLHIKKLSDPEQSRKLKLMSEMLDRATSLGFVRVDRMFTVK